MPTSLQFRRGTDTQNDAFTGAAGELSIDTTNKTIRVHDGSTAGGTRLAKYSEIGSGGGSGTLDSTTVLGVIDAAYIQANQITYSTADFPDSAGVIALISANETTYTNVSEFVNDANYLDSTTVQGVIDATYVQANQTTYSTADFLDSYYATALIDSAYVQARQAAGAGTDPIFKTISVSGQSDVVADTTADTLTLAAGTGISITTNAGTDTITFTATGGGGSGTLDSTTVLDVIDATYIQANQTTYTNVSEFTNDANYLDSTTVQGVVNSAYVNGLVDSVSNATNALTLNNQAASYYLDYNNFSNTPTIPTNNNELTNGAGYITSSALSSYATQSYVTTEINNLIDGAPDTLNTLNEIAAALNDDDSAYATLVNLIGTKTDYDSADTTGIVTNTFIRGLLDDSSVIIDGNGSTGGVTIQDGGVEVRTGTGSVAYVDLYCEVSNAHRARIKSAPHSSYSDNVDLTLPVSTGTLALTSDIPTVPTNVSEFVNDANYLDSTTVQGVIDATYVQSNQITYSTADFPDSAGATTLANAAISSAIGSTVQAQLVSGTNIKTINSQSLLGSGDITITSGSNAFSVIAVSGQDSVVADSTGDTLTLVAGSGITITTTAASDQVTIAATGGGGGASNARAFTYSMLFGG